MTTATTMSRAASKPTATRGTSKKGLPTWAKVGVGAAAVMMAAWGAWALMSMRAPAPDAPVQQVAKFVASERFANLPLDRQRAYIESLDWEKLRELAPEDRRAAMEVVREFREMETVRNYMAMTPEQRRAHLDQVIKEQEERRQEWERRRAEWMAQRPAGAEGQGERGGRPPGADGQGQGPGRGEGRPPGGWGGRNSPEREKARLENRDPGMRAAMAQYRADMAQRRAELGLPPMGRPGGGPGGGGWGGRPSGGGSR